mmetsp:Transcript_44944/g.50816  ORF Transcript_44944/g.50816 Transcript_44944/m.50816 type:complete len:768 (+) Transcript_44944:140-2443(+)
MSFSSGRRFPELKKKLQRRNNSLRPADFTKEHISASTKVEDEKNSLKKRKESLSELKKRIDERKKSPQLKDIQQYIKDYKHSAPLSTNPRKNERKCQERRNDTVPHLIETVDDDDTPTTERDSRDEPNREHSSREETLTQTITMNIQKHNQAPTRGYHPVNNNKLQKNLPYIKKKNHNSNYHRQKKNGIKNDFDAPTHIEVHTKETFDDSSTEVSEITQDFRILSTKGASYAEHRMSGKIKKRLARPYLTGPPGHYLEKDAEVHVSDLKYLSKTVEKAKIDLQQDISPVTIIPRHGLLNEATDCREELDNDDEEDEDYWNDAIKTCKEKPKNAVDPDNIVCIQGPPTPKGESNSQLITNKASMVKLQSLVKVAYSYEGDVFIDATEVRDEDLDGGVPVLTEDGNCCSPIKVDDVTVDTSALLGGEILLERDVVALQGPTNDCINKHPHNMTTRNERSELQASNPLTFRKKVVQESSSVANKNITVVLPVNITDDPNLKKMSNDMNCQGDTDNENNKNPIPAISSVKSSDNDLRDVSKTENDKRDDRSTNNSENKPSTNNNSTSITSEFYHCSRGFFKSFTHQVDTQLKYFKRRGLVSESDMGDMLGILEHDLDETEKKLPKESDDVVIFIGDEFEKSACGIESQVDDNIGKDIGSHADLLESLKLTYKSGVSKCGVDREMIKENAKAIEQMVATLKSKNRKANTSTGPSSQPQTQYSTEEKNYRNHSNNISAEDVEDMLKYTIPIKVHRKTPEPQTFIVPINIHDKE